MNPYDLLKPALFRLEPERAHTLIMTLWDTVNRIPGSGWASQPLRPTHPALAVTLDRIGLAVPNPVGLAGGFDKNAAHILSLARLGFGYLEVGTVTPWPQTGNPRPRLFRLPQDEALINRLGFNNEGVAAMADNLRRVERPVPVGVNIGKNRDTPEAQAINDYVACYRALAPLADYIVVNVSSPNTPGLRNLQRAEALGEILQAIQAERAQLQRQAPRVPSPVFVKLSPDETPADLDAALTVILAAGVDGVIATNTTLDRPASLRGRSREESGGLSGKPLADRATATVRYLYRALEGRLPIIGVGGVDGPDSAYAKILAGASLVQLYTGLIYKGPLLVRDILTGLVARLKRDGFSHISQAVGQEAHRGRAI